MKQGFHLSLLIIAFASCEGQNKTQLDNSSEPKIIPINYREATNTVVSPNLLLNIPWIDHTVIPTAIGC